MNMCFYPDAFERIKESISLNPVKCRLPVVDSFTLYMLLQLHIKGDRFAEHSVKLKTLRPVFSKSNDRRKDKDIIYFLNVLQSAGMITFDLKATEVLFNIFKDESIEPNKYDTKRRFVAIQRSNRHIMEDYSSNVPFAFHCLLHSLQRRNDDVTYPVRISFMEITRRLDVSPDTLDRDKRILERDGYIFTVVGNLNKTDNGVRRECNTYYVFDYNHRKPPEKNQLFRFRRQQWEQQEG